MKETFPPPVPWRGGTLQRNPRSRHRVIPRCARTAASLSGSGAEVRDILKARGYRISRHKRSR